MVSNYDRIYVEINSEAERLAAEHDIDSRVLVSLAMEIVDLEDQHRTKNIRIKQLIEEKILATAVSQMQNEES